MKKPQLTIGMATFDDFDGVYFTVTSLMIHHAEVMANAEVVVVDNNPSSADGKMVRTWIENRVPRGRYFAFEGADGTAQARNEVFNRASGDNVLCVDCHVLLVPDALRRLIDFYHDKPDCRDLLCGPLLMDSGKVAATHQRPQWGSGAYGVWTIDERGKLPDGDPFEIWQQGMGLFSCRKDAWVGFHPEFRGFGGCETYVMEKFRQRGGRVLCCPWLRWTHRFARPRGVPYRLQRNDRIRNYTIGFEELGLDLQPMRKHFGILPKAVDENSEVRGNQKLAAKGRQTTPRSISQYSALHRRQLAVVGDEIYGGVRMRGRLLAQHTGCKLISPSQVSRMSHRETLYAIKGGFCEQTLRRRCDRLIYDPLDVFTDTRSDTNPQDYWRNCYRRFAFDDIIATSPACFDVMREAVPDHVGVHLVPHQCDQRIDRSWADPNGPVVYSGLSAFIRSKRETIEAACALINRPFRSSSSCSVLRNASVALALRLPPYRTELNRYCKPQIKLENAAAAGINVVATDDPAAISLQPDVTTVSADFTAAELAASLKRTLNVAVTRQPFTNGDYLSRIDALIRKDSTVVYTTMFNAGDQLPDPGDKLPGVQYVCFTDNRWLRSDKWDVRYCEQTDDALLSGKRFKILVHEVLNCDVSVFVQNQTDLKRLKSLDGKLTDDLILVRHPQRICIYDEAEHCIRNGVGNPFRIDEAVKRFRAEGHPEAFGLWTGNFIVRRHTDVVRQLNQIWWSEVERGTTQDQISLPVAIRRSGLPYTVLPDNSRISFRCDRTFDSP